MEQGTLDTKVHRESLTRNVDRAKELERALEQKYLTGVELILGASEEYLRGRGLATSSGAAVTKVVFGLPYEVDNETEERVVQMAKRYNPDFQGIPERELAMRARKAYQLLVTKGVPRERRTYKDDFGCTAEDKWRLVGEDALLALIYGSYAGMKAKPGDWNLFYRANKESGEVPAFERIRAKPAYTKRQ